MSDILERLKARLPPNEASERGTVSVLNVPEYARDLRDAIAEIAYLRSVAGAVTLGENMADIKGRNDRLAASLKDKP